MCGNLLRDGVPPRSSSCYQVPRLSARKANKYLCCSLAAMACKWHAIHNYPRY
jgi:hypothetical protein